VAIQHAQEHPLSGHAQRFAQGPDRIGQELQGRDQGNQVKGLARERESQGVATHTWGAAQANGLGQHGQRQIDAPRLQPLLAEPTGEVARTTTYL